MVSKLIQRMRMMKNEGLSMKNYLNKMTFVAIELETLGERVAGSELK